MIEWEALHMFVNSIQELNSNIHRTSNHISTAGTNTGGSNEVKEDINREILPDDTQSHTHTHTTQESDDKYDGLFNQTLHSYACNSLSYTLDTYFTLLYGLLPCTLLSILKSHLRHMKHFFQSDRDSMLNHSDSRSSPISTNTSANTSTTVTTPSSMTIPSPFKSTSPSPLTSTTAIPHKNTFTSASGFIAAEDPFKKEMLNILNSYELDIENDIEELIKRRILVQYHIFILFFLF